ncbi:aryl-alcohol dehydrogenase-like predicted oxidoreductase [Actinoplanes lutulentus]|uniref:Aryl-alcohol dehydrogenase-like predicted oxidoreductase n=1 Tax=Actinoplanes lutulentus TaxID=1287878 RepID=A0A327ZF47_9ACTN|nr:aldo/keto reductase [Actinoplanes lutulentus]MBB2942764.1 aryl-alcohol dehydrogenase-like predicted oxidoreductase [Actinoplanes lutulentus]RAK38344.1 aryl-alcohol dehydrogenase-like predicted oxidoreductase [Actinoplanes lutulentus]
MERRDFGRLGQISALTLGGGGLGGVWGSTDRDEAVATVHAAVDAGITMLDVAPSYGDDFEAERVVGAALRARPAPDVLVTTKVQVHDVPPGGDFDGLIRRSLSGSLSRLGRSHVDLLLLHTQLLPLDGSATAAGTIHFSSYQDAVVPAFERLRAEGLIRGWGITAVGHPASTVEALTSSPRPDAAQVIVNALDLNGDMWIYPDVTPDGPALVAAAGSQGVPVLGIRVVAAGSLAGSLDRAVPADHPAAVDFARAAGFRKLAAEWGEPAAVLAHRYALSVPGVSSVVLGVKNRAELAECVAAEARGRLTPSEVSTIRALTEAR